MGLKRPGQLLIAEVKTRSPFGWESNHSWDELFDIADKHGDIVAVHTDPEWGGSFELLAEARRRTNKRLLAKGIHATDHEVDQAVSAGADFVLTVGRIPEAHRSQCLVEPTDLYSLRQLPVAGLRAVWNERDLRTGEPKRDPCTSETISFDTARTVRPSGWLCQASFIKTIEDVHPAANAVLVGSQLPEFVKTLG